jgi:serine/threonine protein phosphatase 1
MARSWNYNGAETTVASYKEKINRMDEHLDFIISEPLFYNLDDCFLSHAGVSIKYKQFFKNGVPSDKELDEVFKKELDDKNSILWARGSLLNLGKLQVVGHTHRKDVYHDNSSDTLYIDTTAYGNNKLTAVIIDDKKCIEIIEEKSVIADVNQNWIYQL